MKLPDRAPAVCAKLAAGMTLDAICAEADMPGVETINRWLATIPEFRSRYAQARRLRADRMADQIVEIADAITPEGGEDEVRRGRLRIDARKWAVNQLAQTPVPETESLPGLLPIRLCPPDESDPFSPDDAR